MKQTKFATKKSVSGYALDRKTSSAIMSKGTLAGFKFSEMFSIAKVTINNPSDCTVRLYSPIDCKVQVMTFCNHVHLRKSHILMAFSSLLCTTAWLTFFGVASIYMN